MSGHQTRSPWRALARQILKGWAGEGKANSLRKELFPEANARGAWGNAGPGRREGERGTPGGCGKTLRVEVRAGAPPTHASRPTGRRPTQRAGGCRQRPCPRVRQTAQEPLAAAVRGAAATVFPRRWGKARGGGAPLPPAAYGAHKDASAAWAARVLAVEAWSADRKNKRPFGAGPARAPPPASPSTSHPRPRRAHGSCGAARAAHSAAQRDFRWCWTGVAGWVRVAPQGCPGVKASGRAVWKGWGGARSEV
jgi:hypothetical protein